MSRDPRLDDLLGAYELDALDDDERAEVAAYLERSPEARREADSLGAAVAALAAASTDDVPAPTGMWDRIRDAMHDEHEGELPPLRLPRPSPAVTADPAHAEGEPAPVVPLHRNRRTMWAKIAAVAAAVLLTLGLGVTAGRMSAGDDPELSLDQLAAQALADPDARVGTLAGEGTPAVRVVVDPAGRGYLLAGDLPSLPPGRTYQLWGVGADEIVSLAVLGPAPDVVAFPVSAGMTTLAITDEATPGVVSSSQPAVVAGEVN